MNFIIYDLEATCWEGRPPTMVQEIIEIGAIKLNRYGEVEGTFSKFIKPIIHPQLSLFCQQLTSIKQSDVERAATFPSVIEAFQDWAEVFDEEYLLCSWGSFDKKMLIQDCRLHDMEDDWAENHINLKQQYHDIKRLRTRRGLKAALTAEGYEFTGTPHRGIDDARNLAKIFVKHLDVWRW
jgi:3'-5' exoribonuclease 1